LAIRGVNVFGATDPSIVQSLTEGFHAIDFSQKNYNWFHYNQVVEPVMTRRRLVFPGNKLSAGAGSSADSGGILEKRCVFDELTSAKRYMKAYQKPRASRIRKSKERNSVWSGAGAAGGNFRRQTLGPSSQHCEAAQKTGRDVRSLPLSTRRARSAVPYEPRKKLVDFFAF